MAQTTISPTRSPSRETGAEDETRHEQTSLYRVVLLNDDDHTYDYVIEMLQKILVFTLAEAFRHAQEVDARGRTVLITCELSQAEFARDQIQMYGPDWRLPQSKGSMSALVEPAA
jgi:ATP-dependent Clp protease adaptor protein ClpS